MSHIDTALLKEIADKHIRIADDQFPSLDIIPFVDEVLQRADVVPLDTLNKMTQAYNDAVNAQAQSGEPIYQVWDVQRLAWIDVTEEMYDAHFKFERRTVYAAPPSPTAVVLDERAALDAMEHQVLLGYDDSGEAIFGTDPKAQPVEQTRALTEAPVSGSREHFEAAYLYLARERGVELDTSPAHMLGLRDGEGYGARAYLNGMYDGWKLHASRCGTVPDHLSIKQRDAAYAALDAVAAWAKDAAAESLLALLLKHGVHPRD